MKKYRGKGDKRTWKLKKKFSEEWEGEKGESQLGFQVIDDSDWITLSQDAKPVKKRDFFFV